MWARTISYWNSGEYDGLLLANDSCITIRNLDDMFSQLQRTDADLVGVTDSNEIAYHLQSYFIYAKGPHAAEFVCRFISEIAPSFAKRSPDRDALVEECEVGLTQSAIAEGFKAQALWGNSQRKTTLENPALVHPPSLIQAGLPIVKKKYLSCHYSATVKLQVYNQIEHRPENVLASLSEADLPSDLWDYIAEGKKNLKQMRWKLAKYKLLRLLRLRPSQKLNVSSGK